MGKESEMTNKLDLDMSDKVRVVSEEGVSQNATMGAVKAALEEGTATPYIVTVSIGDDKGLIVTEQLSVGTPGDPKETVLGSGDSYPVGTEDTTPEGTPVAGSAWHCDMANTSGQVITGATDVTTILASDTGSTTGLYGGTDTGKYLLVGSEYKFPGMKAKINTAGVIGAGSVQGEFLPGDGEAWTPASLMVSGADYPYEHRGNVLASVDGESEQWHFGFNPLVPRTTWEKTTMTINGTDYTKYWGRFRVVSAITTDPVLEQAKLHTDRVEFNADGTQERYGLAVTPKTLISGLDKLISNSGLTPTSQSVTYDTGHTVAVYENNKFTNNKVDSGLLVQNIEDGIHTGVPLVLSLSYYVAGSEVGDIEWEANVYEITDGFVYDGSADPVVHTAIDTVSEDSALVRRTAKILIPIDNLTYEDAIVIDLRRDATSGNVHDTLEDDCVLTNIRLTAYKWRG